MKRLFSGFLFGSSSSRKSAHLMFKGIPLDGPLDEYVSSLEVAGFRHIGTSNGASLLEGDFAGYRECSVCVISRGGKVCCVTVVFPVRNSFKSLETDYESLKAMLISKYGPPLDSMESFDGYIPADPPDTVRLRKLAMNECTYRTLFSFPKGMIALHLLHSSSGPSASIVYIDELNYSDSGKVASDDL